jgi:hypothetical protein
MNARVTSLLLFATLFCADALAQVVPTTPKKFSNRITGSQSNMEDGGVSVAAPAPTPPVTTTITYVTLSPARQWLSSDGKSLLGKLIAFEDFRVQTTGKAAAPMPDMPKNPTVVRDGKARLLVNGKPFEIALDRLSEADRQFVEGIRAGLAKK